MQADIQLMSEYVNSRWFDQIPFLILFTHHDLFCEMLKNIKFQDHFPDYHDANEPNKIINYIVNLVHKYSDKTKKRYYIMRDYPVCNYTLEFIKKEAINYKMYNL